MKEFSEKEFLLLSYLEGDLTKAEKEKVEAMLAEDAALMNEYRLLAKTILSQENISYTNKASLKKPVATKTIALSYVFWSGAVAAALAILILFYAPKANTTSTKVATNNATSPQSITVDENTDSEIDNASNNIALASPKAEEKIKKAESNNGTQVKTNRVEDIQNYIATTNEQFKKETLVATTLAPKAITIDKVEIPKETVVLNTELPKPLMPTIKQSEGKNWWVRKANKINNTINTWASYLQKPKVEIGKKEPIGGRTYWAITVEAERYEWEGKLYTRR